MMLRFHKALNAWGTPDFESVLKQEIAQADPALLPLQQGLSTGSHVTEGPVSAMIIRVLLADG